MKGRDKRILGFILLALFFLALIISLSIFSPSKIVDKIGIRNSYLVIFFVSLFGGFSTGGALYYMGLLVTFILGGLNPLYLGIISGIGLGIGDNVLFYFFHKGRELVNGKWDKKIEKFSLIFEKKKWTRKWLPFLAYVYIALTPFPNDLMMLFLAAIEYDVKKTLWIIVLGDITFALAFSFLVFFGVGVVF